MLEYARSLQPPAAGTAVQVLPPDPANPPGLYWVGNGDDPRLVAEPPAPAPAPAAPKR